LVRVIWVDLYGSVFVRILFSCRPLTGHLHPLLPLAQAAAAAGHEVAFATAEPALSDARGRGFEAFSAGPGIEAREAFVRNLPDLRALTPEEHRALFFTQLFVGVELAPRLRDLSAIVERWTPDVIVHEVAELAAPIAATAAGLPYVTSGFGPLLSPAVAAQAGRAAAPHWRAAGLAPHPRGGLYEHLYFDPCPPALQVAAIHDVPAVPMRVTPLPTVRFAGAHPATAYVTFGTLWNRDLDTFRAVLAALSAHPVDVVVTLGADGDPAALGAQPEHVHIHRFIAQAELLPRCDAVIAHGGAGTMLGALAHGLPLLVLPQGADQYYNAERVAAAGAGLSLAPELATSAAIAHAVDTLLGDARLRAGAQRVAAEIAAMPGPDTAVAHLQALARPLATG
jgi:UDP:flavonoid glycosyltransferase YjiC (YdhE family)